MRFVRHLPWLIGKARQSSPWLWLLNRVLERVVGFNRPHGFKILEIHDNRIRGYAPSRRRNKNHVGGIHACAIATIGELSAGFLLLTKLDPLKYRLIMSHLEVEFKYQAKEPIISEAALDEEQFKKDVLYLLGQGEASMISMEAFVHDLSGNEVAKVKTKWQIKPWESVQTSVE